MELQGQAVQAATEPPPAQAPRSPLVDKASALLHKRCRIRVKDGRVLVGEFACMDKQGNVILLNTYEHVTIDGRLYEKQMGQVLVGAAQRVSCEFEALPFEEERLRQLLASAGG